MTVSTWVGIAWLGGAGGVVSAWLTRRRETPRAGGRMDPNARRVAAWFQLGNIALGAATAAATAWLLGTEESPSAWAGVRAIPAALAFFWIGFVTAGWMAAERDKRVLRQAVCSAATAPAAHPETVEALATASPDAVYEAVKALIPRRAAH